ncbi:MAG TPA: OB-fold nucleic acid binding domain-containing protein [Rectinemataceae bacterium]|nr:OB-fold nucleic acid binding domain-containing protein [Rectinemataceae bacterium]
MCYQEDVSKVAVALAGFSPAEADGMRKVLSKKDAVTRLESFRPKFEEGAGAREVDEATIGAAWEMICSFAGYSFVKAHSASYARLSFRSAWLRAHHPAEFMAAVMSNRGGYYTILAYASEARRMGLRLLPPSVDESDLRSRGSGRDIRFGLGLIAGLGEATARRIVEERNRRGPYRDIDDFARRIDPDRDDAEALVESGALDGLVPELRRSALLMRLLRHSALREVSTSLGPGLFDLPGAVEPAGLAFSEGGGRRAPGGRGEEARGESWEISRESPRSRLLSELRRLGTTLEVHPLALWPQALAAPRCLAKDLGDHVGERVTILGWPVTAKEVMAKGEQPMEFVSFEDETALVEVVVFPEAYRRFGGLLFEERPFFISGKVALDRGGLTLELLRLDGIPDGNSGPDRLGRAFHVFQGYGNELPALR